MLESGLIFESCNVVSEIYMQCTAIKPHSKYRRMMKRTQNSKNSSTSQAVLYWAGSAPFNIFRCQRLHGATAMMVGGNGCNCFSWPVCEHSKRWQQARVVWLRTNSWLYCPCLGWETAWFLLALDYTEFYVNFYLDLTITKFYLYSHVPCWPGKSNPLSLSSQNSVAGTLVEQVVPDQGS